MGGDHLPCSASEDELSSLDYEYPDHPVQTSSIYRDGLRTEDEDESISGSYVFVPSKLDEVNHEFSSNSREFEGNLRRRKNAYNEIIRGYDELWVRNEGFHQAKSRILSYNPGSWISSAGGKKLKDFVIPKTTTLLLIGPKGSGKSSLVNRISRVFEDDKFSSERAQVTYNPSAGEGTYFLQEYMIPRGSTSFCLFDSRSLSENFADNDEMLKSWMTKGVRHGELVIRDSDDPILKMSLKCKAQRGGNPSSVIRKVNFVIFVINGFEVLRSMNSDMKKDKSYIEMVVKTLSCPYLSFKDDKPVVVVTHGDLLSLDDRAHVRLFLGEKLGVPPTKQIFDIPDNCDPSSELMIVDMIRYSLEHADKNMPCKESKDWLNRSTFLVDSVKDKKFVGDMLDRKKKLDENVAQKSSVESKTDVGKRDAVKSKSNVRKRDSVKLRTGVAKEDDVKLDDQVVKGNVGESVVNKDKEDAGSMQNPTEKVEIPKLCEHADDEVDGSEVDDDFSDSSSDSCEYGQGWDTRSEIEIPSIPPPELPLSSGLSPLGKHITRVQVSGMSILTLILTAILLGIACIIIPMNQVHTHSDPLVESAIKWPSYETHHPYEPQEPLTAHQSNLESTSAANHRSPVYNNAESDVITPIPPFPKEPVAVTSEPTSVSEDLEIKSEQASPLKSVVVTSEPTSISDDLEIKSEQASPLKSVVVTSKPTSISETIASKSDEALPSKSTKIKPEPTLPSKSVTDYRRERRKPRSPSHEHRHPKAAVKWHKIRHLWLDSD